MSKKSGLGKVLAGVGIGAALGLLFAPKSGEETRKDLKKQADNLAKKIKDVDLDELKDNLLDDFYSLKDQLKDMDADKAREIAKTKGKELADRANELMDMAREKSAPVVEKAAKDVKKKVVEMLDDASKKLRDEK